jgi:hypothetical protein
MIITVSLIYIHYTSLQLQHAQSLLFVNLIILKYEYIINTTQFAENMSKLKLNPEHKLLTMDIKYLYVKIPNNYTVGCRST